MNLLQYVGIAMLVIPLALYVYGLSRTRGWDAVLIALCFLVAASAWLIIALALIGSHSTPT